ncbi:MAG TPA: DUF551 domain-containing protein, partial [Casimicrobiaceae bacterium]|nr:DUF551 domain-containing protein [Casimicrobiaceae bacterium]
MPPADVIAAAGKVSDWFAERNIKDWRLDGCMARSDWISVDERMPAKRMAVLVARDMGNVLKRAIALYDGECWHA